MAEKTSKKKRAKASKQSSGQGATKKKVAKATAGAAKKAAKKTVARAGKKAASSSAKKKTTTRTTAKTTKKAASKVSKSVAKKATATTGTAAKKPKAPRTFQSGSAPRPTASTAPRPASASVGRAPGSTPVTPTPRKPTPRKSEERKTIVEPSPQGTLFPEVTAAPRGRAVFDDERTFPRDFLWGTATSATQVDGGDPASDWIEFCNKKGRIADGSSPAIACDHWNRYEADYSIMQELGLGAYRLGVDWSRFEPEPGQWNFAALDHLREMLASLNKKRIRPLLTLNHFTLPQWWQARGGWTREHNLIDFYKFVDFIVAGVGDLVNEYVTINEPNIYAFFGFMEGMWPPGKTGLSGYLRSMQVQRNMLLAHFTLYDRIREIHASKNYAHPVIGAAMHYQIVDPLRPDSALDENRTMAANLRFNEVWTDGIASGRLPRPLGKNEKVHDGEAWDFYGLNYYSRRLVSFSAFAPHHLFIRSEIKSDAPVNDLGWEIYPEGLTRVLIHLHQKYNMPIRITENGIAAANDQMRVDFLRSHLDAMGKAIQRGVPVEAYYHWSLLDNFEWAEGYSARFGLVGVNFETQERTVRESARAYAQIIRTGVVR